LPMVPHCGSFSNEPRRPLHQTQCTNLKIGTCHVKVRISGFVRTTPLRLAYGTGSTSSV